MTSLVDSGMDPCQDLPFVIWNFVSFHVLDFLFLVVAGDSLVLPPGFESSGKSVSLVPQDCH